LGKIKILEPQSAIFLEQAYERCMYLGQFFILINSLQLKTADGCCHDKHYYYYLQPRGGTTEKSHDSANQ